MFKLWEVFRDLISTLKIPGSLFKARVGPPQRPVMHNDGAVEGSSELQSQPRAKRTSGRAFHARMCSFTIIPSTPEHFCVRNLGLGKRV